MRGIWTLSPHPASASNHKMRRIPGIPHGKRNPRPAQRVRRTAIPSRTLGRGGSRQAQATLRPIPQARSGSDRRRTAVRRCLRLVAGVAGGEEKLGNPPDPDWSNVSAGSWLAEILKGLRSPDGLARIEPGSALQATLRAYQQAGVRGIYLLHRLATPMFARFSTVAGEKVQALLRRLPTEVLQVRRTTVRSPDTGLDQGRDALAADLQGPRRVDCLAASSTCSSALLVRAGVPHRKAQYIIAWQSRGPNGRVLLLSRQRSHRPTTAQRSDQRHRRLHLAGQYLHLGGLRGERGYLRNGKMH